MPDTTRLPTSHQRLWSLANISYSTSSRQYHVSTTLPTSALSAIFSQQPSSYSWNVDPHNQCRAKISPPQLAICLTVMLQNSTSLVGNADRFGVLSTGCQVEQTQRTCISTLGRREVILKKINKFPPDKKKKSCRAEWSGQGDIPKNSLPENEKLSREPLK